jgi:radical SAM protein with 4Fe4S-binding SPASM domain
MMIDATGNVQPCAYRNNYNNPSPHPPCGNVNQQSVQEIWNGEEYQNLRENMAKGDLQAAGCANCLALKQGQPLQLQYDADADKEDPPVSAYARNLQLKRQEVAAGATVLKSLPTVVFFTPTHHCNLRCVHCYQDLSRTLSLSRKEAGEEVLELLPVMDQIVAGGGEPLLLPIWKRFISSADLSINPYLQFATTTNATRISDEILAGLGRFKRLALTVSLDGATKEVFESIRLRGKLDEVVANIDKLIALTNSKPTAAMSVTFSVMKGNLCGMPDIVRFCAEKKIGYNLLPVVAYPVDQSLRCFNNPRKQMKGWRESIAESRRLFESVFLRRYPLSDGMADLYRGHFTALEGHVPWHMLETPHFPIREQVPQSLLKPFRDHKGQELLIGFFPCQDGVPGECMYYAPLEGNVYEVHLPRGEYALAVFPRNAVPFPAPSARLQVNPSGVAEVILSISRKTQYLLMPLARTAYPILRQGRRLVRLLAGGGIDRRSA